MHNTWVMPQIGSLCFNYKIGFSNIDLKNIGCILRMDHSSVCIYTSHDLEHLNVVLNCTFSFGGLISTANVYNN